MLEATLLVFTLYNKTSGQTPLDDGKGRNLVVLRDIW